MVTGRPTPSSSGGAFPFPLSSGDGEEGSSSDMTVSGSARCLPFAFSLGTYRRAPSFRDGVGWAPGGSRGWFSSGDDMSFVLTGG